MPLGQHCFEHYLRPEHVFLAHAVIQNSFYVINNRLIDPARLGRHERNPFCLVGIKPLKQRGSVGSGGRCPEDG